jgi:hypothetical protein
MGEKMSAKPAINYQTLGLGIGIIIILISIFFFSPFFQGLLREQTEIQIFFAEGTVGKSTGMTLKCIVVSNYEGEIDAITLFLSDHAPTTNSSLPIIIKS